MCCAGFIETRAECRRRCSPASQHSLQSRVWGLLKGQARINVQKLLMLNAYAYAYVCVERIWS